VHRDRRSPPEIKISTVIVRIGPFEFRKSHFAIYFAFRELDEPGSAKFPSSLQQRFWGTALA
jgi:hypothetical protein